MQFKSKMVAVAGVITTAVAMSMAPATAATPVVDVSNHHVVCDGVTGSMKFSVPLTLGGTSANQISIKLVADGCSDTDDGSLVLAPAKIAGTLNSNTSDCAGLVGLSTGTTGSVTASWKTAKTSPAKITPTSSTETITQNFGGTFSNPWGVGGGYGLFQIGTAYGTAAPSVTGAFTGGDGGASSEFAGTTGQSTSGILSQCISGGLKAITFGIGYTTLG